MQGMEKVRKRSFFAEYCCREAPFLQYYEAIRKKNRSGGHKSQLPLTFMVITSILFTIQVLPSLCRRAHMLLHIEGILKVKKLYRNIELE